MTKLSVSAFVSKWNGKFADNSTRVITEAFMREFSGDVTDSFLGLTDQEYSGVKGAAPGINTIAGLKSIVTVTLTIGVLVSFRDTGNSNVLRVYELTADTAAEVSPSLIRPNDYDGTANQKVWKLAVLTSGNIGRGFMGDSVLVDTLEGGTSTFQGNFWRRTIASTTLTTADGSLMPAGLMMMAKIDNPSTTNIADWIFWYSF